MIDMGATLARGALIGFAIAAPVGPVGLLCIRRTFAHGARTGLASGLGAATADAMYGLVAALGVSAVAALLLEHAALLRIVGGLLMAGLGVAALARARAMPTTPQQHGAQLPASGHAPASAAGAAAQAASPVPAAAQTVAPVPGAAQAPGPVPAAAQATAPVSAARGATAGGLFAAFGTTFALTASSPMTILSFAGLLAALAPPDGSMRGGLILVAGVFAGSIAWWTLLVGGVSASRKAVSPRMLRIIEAVSGIALLAFAAWSLITGVAMA
jgi:threonine/homoserine/homoserine lactone efflux protein